MVTEKCYDSAKNELGAAVDVLGAIGRRQDPSWYPTRLVFCLNELGYVYRNDLSTGDALQVFERDRNAGPPPEGFKQFIAHVPVVQMIVHFEDATTVPRLRDYFGEGG